VVLSAGGLVERGTQQRVPVAAAPGGTVTGMSVGYAAQLHKLSSSGTDE